MKEELNLKCPYKVYLDKESSIYSFTNKYDIEYMILFSEYDERLLTNTTEIKVEKVYDLTIHKNSENKDVLDADTGLTIKKITEEFFKDKDNSIFYTCNSIDNKQHKRAKRFSRWSKEVAESLDIEHYQRKYNVSKISKKYPQYSGVIFRSDNSYSEDIKIQFDNTIDDWED